MYSSDLYTVTFDIYTNIMKWTGATFYVKSSLYGFSKMVYSLSEKQKQFIFNFVHLGAPKFS